MDKGLMMHVQVCCLGDTKFSVKLYNSWGLNWTIWWSQLIPKWQWPHYANTLWLCDKVVFMFKLALTTKYFKYDPIMYYRVLERCTGSIIAVVSVLDCTLCTVHGIYSSPYHTIPYYLCFKSNTKKRLFEWKSMFPIL